MTADIKKILKVVFFSVFLLFIVIYAFSRSKDLIWGVKIKNTNLADGKVEDNVARITGKAKNALSLILNGRVISINQAGDFDETIALLPGYNIVNIKAEDKFGNSDEKNYQIIK
ncbi:MAG: hypothetical protein UT09_C0001G0005 [Parcubacteria group bacterium GW2011_GWF2_38_8]|nr:MAG: hypothetical protein UT09_C0001G0005 [Parcubacteria group bacterium GW2011_GWF2_38_8]